MCSTGGISGILTSMAGFPMIWRREGWDKTNADYLQKMFWQKWNEVSFYWDNYEGLWAVLFFRLMILKPSRTIRIGMMHYCYMKPSWLMCERSWNNIMVSSWVCVQNWPQNRLKRKIFFFEDNFTLRFFAILSISPTLAPIRQWWSMSSKTAFWRCCLVCQGIGRIDNLIPYLCNSLVLKPLKFLSQLLWWRSKT